MRQRKRHQKQKKYHSTIEKPPSHESTTEKPPSHQSISEKTVKPPHKKPRQKKPAQKKSPQKKTTKPRKHNRKIRRSTIFQPSATTKPTNDKENG
jgi:hypothetical protein